MSFSILGKAQNVVPTYEIRPTGPQHRQRFLCELRVPGFEYVAVGNSTSKKDAQTNAARDFVAFLVRQGMIQSRCGRPHSLYTSLELVFDLVLRLDLEITKYR